MNIYAILGPLEVCLERMNIEDFFDKSGKLPDLPSQATQFEELAHELKTRAGWKYVASATKTALRLKIC